MTDNGQKVQFIPGNPSAWLFDAAHDGRIVFSGLCPFCAGDFDGCGACTYSGDIAISDASDYFAEAFALNLRYVNFETAYRLGKELATAARLKLEAMGVNGWEVSK